MRDDSAHLKATLTSVKENESSKEKINYSNKSEEDNINDRETIGTSVFDKQESKNKTKTLLHSY